ncbi:MAG TPA: amidohydrolase [Vicinamibacteria bacterium]|nr:amidohydrolase [Vicinamibacteria bacterium]
MPNRRRAPFATLVWALLAAFPTSAETRKASLVLTGGRIWTGDPGRPWATAITVGPGGIVAVGDDAQVGGSAAPDARRVALGGRFVMPGINDAHIHFIRGSLRLTHLDLNGARSLEEIRQRLAAFAKANPSAPGNRWIQGYGWQYTVRPGGRLPTRKDLDDVVSDRPVFLAAYDGHTGWANSAALSLAGVDAKTAFPGWGEIVRDAQGEPTGVFKEQAQGLIGAAIPKPSRDEERAALRRGLARAASLGITSIQNAHGTPEDVELFREADAAGELTLRVGVAQTLRPPIPAERIDAIQALAARNRSGLVRVRAVKIVADGVIEAHTAALLAPYTDAPETRGLPGWTQEQLDESVARADRAGLQVYIHAIGDGGVRMSLDAFERARKANGRPDSRFRIEHLETIDAADVPRFAKLGVLASMMPIHADPDTIGVWTAAIGPERSSRAFAWRLMERAGARLVFSSDWPSTLTLDPWRGLHCAVNRTTDAGRPAGGWLPEHAISVESALRAYTSGGAYAEFEEKEKGVLAPGMKADLVVLSGDPFRMDPAQLHTLSPEMTVFDGRVVFEKAPASH